MNRTRYILQYKAMLLLDNSSLPVNEMAKMSTVVGMKLPKIKLLYQSIAGSLIFHAARA